MFLDDSSVVGKKVVIVGNWHWQMGPWAIAVQGPTVQGQIVCLVMRSYS